MPRFHHLHLNSVDPDAAIDFYVHQFASTSRTMWGGSPALASPNDVLILFSQVSSPPAVEPDTAIWHFGWHVTDVRRSLKAYRECDGLTLLPLYTGESDNFVHVAVIPGRERAGPSDAHETRSQKRDEPEFNRSWGPDLRICRGPTPQLWNTPAIIQPSGSTTYTCGRSNLFAHRSGTSST